MSHLRHTVIRWLPARLRHALRAWNSSRQVRHFTEERWPEAAVVRQLIRPGDVVVDAGANIGYLSALLARWVGPSGLVHSIEPIPETFQLLQNTMQKLGLRQVRCHDCGVSDRSGDAVMEVPAYPDGAENFYESHVVTAAQLAENARAIKVRLMTLDEVVGETLPRVSFMKVDVEGHEESALLGAARLLEQARPALLVEINHSLDQPTAETARLLVRLESLGYRVYVREGTKVIRRRPGQRAVDYFFLTSDHLSDRLGAL
jgi:FkbM family methyltransferase